MNRHRFEGEVGGLCLKGVGVTCGLNYSASLHYNDDDHPYMYSSTLAGCGWELQNVSKSAPDGLVCSAEEDNPVHQQPPDPEETVVINAPFDGFSTGEHRVLDVPAEDGGVGPGSWSYLGTPPEPDTAQILRDVGILTGKEGAAARARWALQNSGVVTDGPWPVRQYFWGPGDLEIAGLELVEALTRCGEAFVFETWWADQQTRLCRVQWGSLLMASVGELYAAVESWPEA